MAQRSVVVGAVVLVGCVLGGSLLSVVAEGPGTTAAQQSVGDTMKPSPQELMQAIQDNNLAIQRFVGSQRQTNVALNTVMGKLAEQGNAFRVSVDQKVLSKNKDGAALIKKEKAIRDELAALAEKTKAKQAELAVLVPQRGEQLQKLTKDPDYLALVAQNSQITKTLNEEMFSIVAQISDEGKKLVEERNRLIALQNPSSVKPQAPAVAK